MKINIITKYFYPRSGGIEDAIKDTYKHLVNSGWEVIVHTSRYEQSLPKNSEIEGIRIIRYDNLSRALLKMKIHDGELFVISNFEVSLAIPVLFRLLIIKKVFGRRIWVELAPYGGFATNWSVYPIIKRELKRLIHMSIGAVIVNMACDYVRAVSEWEKNELIKLGVSEDKIKVIRSGVKVNNEFSGAKDIGNYILCVNKIRKDKNILKLVKAMKYLKNTVELVIIGEVVDPDYFVKINKYVKANNLSKRVKFINRVKSRTLGKYINGSRIVVSINEWENYGSFIREAMCMGALCICRADFVYGEIINDGKNGYLFDSLSLQNMAKKMDKVLVRDNSQVKENAKKICDFESRDKISEILDERYRNLIK